MLDLFSDMGLNKKGLGNINALLIATTCCIIVGLLLLDTDSKKTTDIEMQQYLITRQPAGKTLFTPNHYNPFALAPKTTAPASTDNKSDWLVPDTKWQTDDQNRNILDSIIQANNQASEASNHESTEPDQQLAAIFKDIYTMTQALATYYKSNQRWPEKRQLMQFNKLPKSIASIALTQRGILTITLKDRADVIQLSASTSETSIKWYCQTTVANRLLGQGARRLCIHSNTLHLSG